MTENIKQLILSGLALHRKNAFTEAEAVYRRVLAADPGQPDALYFLGMIALQRSDNGAAVKLMTKAVERKRAEPEYYANLAVALQNLGGNQEAVTRCREALALKPDQFTALNTMGNALMQLGRQQEAVDCFRRAITLAPDIADLRVNLANALKALGKLDEAAVSYQAAVRLAPRVPGTRYLLGLSLRQLGRLDEAVAALETAVQLKPGYAEALNILGNIETERGALERAGERYQQAIEAQPASADARYNLANIQRRLKLYEQAARNYRDAWDLRPGLSDAAFGLAEALYELGRYSEAESAYQSVLAIQPGRAEALNGLGNALRMLGRPEEAYRSYRAALDLQPLFAEGYFNISNLQLDQGQVDEAISSCERALAVDPEMADAHWNLGLALLTRGDLVEGWFKYEYRFLKKGAEAPLFPQPDWDGSALAGKVLLIYAEQGVGDEIMFASCVSDALACGGVCVVECDKRLAPLFARSFPDALITARMESHAQYPRQLPSPELKVALGSLPRYFRPSLDRFPRKHGYLIPDQAAVNRWKERYEALGKGMKIGISWKGGKEAFVRRTRSTTLEQWRDILETPNAHFISLQYGDCRDEMRIARERSGVPIHEWADSDAIADLDDFAAKIAALDLVIAADSSTVHLAGAVGVPVWTLLPFGAEWRWLREVDDSPWYPSMRLFRQDAPGGWATVFTRVAANIAAWTAGQRPSGAARPFRDRTDLRRTPRGTIALLNDTTHWYHWGCTGTSTAIRETLVGKGYAVDTVPITAVTRCRQIPRSIEDFDSPGFFQDFSEANPWIMRSLRHADIVVVNGEGSLHGMNEFVLGLLYLIYASRMHLGRNVRIINHSCYPDHSLSVTDAPGWALYKKVYRAVDFAAIREPLSFGLLKDAGIHAEQSFDCLPLYIRAHYERRPSRADRMIVLAGSVVMNSADASPLVRLVRELFTRGYDVRFLAGADLYAAGDDERLMQVLSQACPEAWSLVRAGSITEWLDTLAQASLLISGRFHHTVAAAALGTPYLLLSSNTPKNAGLAKALEGDPPLNCQEEDFDALVMRRAEEALEGGRRRGEPLLMQRLCDQAMKNFLAL